MLFRSLNYTPSADKIEYITLVQDESPYSEPTYFERILGNYKITEPELINFVSDKLADTVKHCKNNNAYNNFSRDDYSVISVGIKSGVFMKYRNLCIPEDEFKQFYNILYANNDIQQIFTNLPEYDKYSALIEIGGAIDEKKSEEIYNTLREELKSIDPANWAEQISMNNSPIGLTFQTIIDDKTTYTNMPLNIMTPKTLLAYINTINASITKNDADKINRVINAVDQNSSKDDDMGYSISIDLLSEDFKFCKSYCIFDSDYRGPLEIYKYNRNDSGEVTEDNLIASIDDESKIIDFVKSSFSNPAPIESIDSENYSILSINFSSYDYSNYFDHDADDSLSIEDTVYVLMESDKIEQFIAGHSVK